MSRLQKVIASEGDYVDHLICKEMLDKQSLENEKSATPNHLASIVLFLYFSYGTDTFATYSIVDYHNRS